MPATATEPQIGLLELILGMMELAADQHGVRTFPCLYDPAWHRLLYGLTRNPGACEILQNIIGECEWDGENPRYPKLESVMFGLPFVCLPGLCSEFRIALDPRIRLVQNLGFTKPPRFDEAVARAYEVVNQISGFFTR